MLLSFIKYEDERFFVQRESDAMTKKPTFSSTKIFSLTSVSFSRNAAENSQTAETER